MLIVNRCSISQYTYYLGSNFYSFFPKREPLFECFMSFRSLLHPRLLSHLRTMSSTAGIIENTIRSKLTTVLATKHLDVINESYMHNVPKGSETHFKVVVVSDKFNGLPLIKRHRLVNSVLKEELETGVHALSIVAKTPAQWEESDKVVESSPNCKGGFGK